MLFGRSGYSIQSTVSYVSWWLSVTKEEYKNRLSELQKQHALNLIDLRSQFALKNNTVKVGDTVTDHIGTIVVEKIKIETSFIDSFPECTYFGYELTKKLERKKSGAQRWVYQSNLKAKEEIERLKGE